MERLLWGVPSLWIERLPVYFGRHRGLFRERGIDLALRCYWGGAAVTAALAAGRVLIGEIGLPPLLRAAAVGCPARVIGSSAIRRLDHYLAARPGFGSLADLRGGSVGILAEGSCDDYFLTRMLQGVPVRRVALGRLYGQLRCFHDTPPPGVPRLDAGFLVEPFLSAAESRGLVKILAVVRDYFPVFQWGVLFAHDRLLSGNRDLARRALQAFRASCRAVAQDPRAAASFGAQVFRLPREVLLRALLRDLPSWELEAELDPEGLRSCLRLQVELGAVPASLPLGDLIRPL